MCISRDDKMFSTIYLSILLSQAPKVFIRPMFDESKHIILCHPLRSRVEVPFDTDYKL